MKYAVTGGAGFIGSHLIKNLVEHGNEVIVIDNLNTGKKQNIEKISKKIDFFEVDIRDFNAIEDILKNVDGVFHEAALASVQDSFRIPDEFFDVNVNGTENIFKIAKKLGIKVVYASSSSVYGNPISIPIKENDDKNQFNPYAKTKLEEVTNRYPKPEEIRKMYEQTPQLMDQIRSAVIEDLVIDWLMERTEFQNKEVEFKELMKRD